MRLVPLLVAAFIIAGCSTGALGSSTPTRLPAADTHAADLRTQLDLLLGEHVMLIAKEAEAAAYQPQTDIGYSLLLDDNAQSLAAVVGRAFGTSAAHDFYVIWSALNRDLIQYGTGLMVHEKNLADQNAANLTNEFLPRFAQLLSGLTGLSSRLITQLTSTLVAAAQAAIVDVVTANFSKLYSDIRAAYLGTTFLGDTLTRRIAEKFPDKFPGDPSTRAVGVRVTLNNLLLEHAYLATMETSAEIAPRGAEIGPAADSLDANGSGLSELYASAFGKPAGDSFKKLWLAREQAIVAYSVSGLPAWRDALATGFVSDFCTLTKVSTAMVDNQVTATIKVLDDQRGKAYATLANDDHAAATAMQPIADALAAAALIQD